MNQNLHFQRKKRHLFAMLRRRRPTLFAASCLMLLASVGLWAADVIVWKVLPEDVTMRDMIATAGYYALFLILPMGVYVARHRGLSDALRLNPMPFSSMLMAVLMGLVSVYAASALGTLWSLALDALGFEAWEVSIEVGTERDLALAVLTTAALPAVCEELLFRGFVFSAWESRGTSFAIALSSVLFGLIHGNLYGLPVYVMVGAISAYMVFAFDTLYAGMVYHTVYNSALLMLSHVLSGMSEEAAASVSDASLASAALVQLLLSGMLLFALLSAIHVRRRQSDIIPFLRARKPVRLRDKLMLAAVVAVMLFTLLMTTTVASL